MIPAALLTLLVVIYRVVLGFLGTPDTADLQWLHNFSPLASVALCGAIYFPRRFAVILPLGALLLSDVILNAHYHLAPLGWAMLPGYLALGLMTAVGLWLRREPKLGRIVLASVAGSVVFYLVTNTAAWAVSPAYAHNAAGWVQALTTGEPGYTPTWAFFRNSLVSDLLFTGLFVACMQLTAEPRKGAVAIARA